VLSNVIYNVFSIISTQREDSPTVGTTQKYHKKKKQRKKKQSVNSIPLKREAIFPFKGK
jgi:hypothetical protein